MKAKFLFGDIVVVEGNLIGVIVKTWYSYTRSYHYEVYVRNWNIIKDYNESDIDRYRVRHKELNDEELVWQGQVE
jgi:uncharacterized protein YraI